MEVKFEDVKYEKLYTNLKGFKGFSNEMIKPFFKTVEKLRAVPNLEELKKMSALDFKKCDYYKLGHYSVRVNKQYRLILKIQDDVILIICEMTDYHDRI